ncbi:secretion system type I outer membrane efflux pump lipoprotein NodT [Neokomagataea thailandica NBRC 106555]|uniref:TolC family protein n=2 Tax=Neokomagataea TaxID=1223423 RepID=A0A4Y6V9D7_9PROT|nr:MULTISPECIES: TolC family protein [Neokomagataea]QDH25528.1 TolC family protein [Neokomagataea tanensis]GBR51261.1 secretion system type I outer membrane efflux pump lipoprotein NodT [Neokomagataea thailandica NBRC 106555]
MRVSHKLTVLGCVTLLSVGGCKVGPNFKPDTFAPPAAFTDQKEAITAEDRARTAASLKDWWHLFKDPTLDGLVDTAIHQNYTLQAAAQHVIAAEALRREAASAWYPQLDAMAGGGDDRYSIVVDNWPLRPGDPANRPQASVLTYGARASWEIDLFGHIGRQVEAQSQEITASVEEQRALLVAVIAELASNYIALRGTQARLTVVEHDIGVASDTLAITQRLYTKGLANSLDVAQVTANQRIDEARIPPLHAEEDRLIHSIAVLAGQIPGSLESSLKVRQPMPSVPSFPAALPSEVIAQRADIRAQEARYAAATARVGVAVSQLYPRFSIPMTFNPNASAVYQAFQLGAMSWSVMMMASLPLMHGGRNNAEIMRAKAAAEASRLAYRQTVLQAFKEVEDALSDWEQDNELVLHYNQAIKASKLAQGRAQRRYAVGLTSVLDVLSTNRLALRAEEHATIANAARLRDTVRLYTAIGAGWQGYALPELPVTAKQQSIWAKTFSP